MRKIVGWGFGTVSLTMMLITNAHAHGAYAEGLKGGSIDPWGFSGGYSIGASSQYEAMYLALKECVEGKGFAAEVRAECKVVATFRGQCFAVSFQDKGSGYGWAVEASKSAAEKRARQKCDASANPRVASVCAIAASVCDTDQTVAGSPSGNALLSNAPGVTPQSGSVGLPRR